MPAVVQVKKKKIFSFCHKLNASTCTLCVHIVCVIGEKMIPLFVFCRFFRNAKGTRFGSGIICCIPLDDATSAKVSGLRSSSRYVLLVYILYRYACLYR